MSQYAKEAKIPMGDRSKLKKAIEILSPAKEKKAIYLNTEEIKITQSMQSKITQFKNIVNTINMQENNMNQQKKQIINQIKNQFNILSEKLLDKKLKLIAEINLIIDKKVKSIQTEIICYNESLEEIENIKEQNDELMDVPISINKIDKRQIKVCENYNAILKIIKDTNENNSVAITGKMSFNIDMDNALEFINKLGCITETGLPIIEKLSHDNAGNVKLFWKMAMNDDIKNDDDKQIHIEYHLIADESKSNETNWKSKDVFLNNNICATIKVNKTGSYNFKIKYYSNKVWSQYSNIKSIDINTINTLPILKWNTKENMYGHYNTGKQKTIFVNDNTVSIYWATASVDYIIKAQDVDEFCFEFQVKNVAANSTSLDSAFGFTQYPLDKYVTNLNTAFYSQNAYGVYFNNTTATVYAATKQIKTLTLPHSAKYKENDKIGYKINMKKKTAELFYNGNSLGVIYENIPDAIIPLVNGNGYSYNVNITVYTTQF